MHWKHPGSSPIKKFKRVSSAGTVMASIFWDSQALSWWISTINCAYYTELRWLHQEIVKKRRGLKMFCSCKIMHQPTTLKLLWLLRINAASRSFLILPYSPDLASSDFSLFPNLKTNLHGRNFGSNEGVTNAVDEYSEPRRKG